MIQSKFNRHYLAVLVLFSGIANAQSFQYKAALDSIHQSGFYSIWVTPELSTKFKTDFSDLRVTDIRHNPIPYLLGSDIRILDSTQFTTLPIIKTSVNDSGQSVLIVTNQAADNIDGFYIRIRNAAVSRTISLSGSPDGEKWYSIIENVNLDKQFIQSQNSFLEFISFPLSSYPYFRVMIYNGKNDPLNIISIQHAIHSNPVRRDTLLPNPPCSFICKDSGKITWIRVENSRRFHVDHVIIRVTSPRYYKRELEVLTGGSPEGSFMISSDSLINLSLPKFNDSSFLIKINNEDNPPLVIAKVSTGQTAEKIVTYLDSGKSYQLEMTNRSAAAPHYDLVNFKDSIPKNPSEIRFSNIVPVPVVLPGNESVLKRFWLWPSLIFVLIVLGLFTYRLTKDVSKDS